MVWFFHKDGDIARCEVRRGGTGFEVAVQASPRAPELIYQAGTPRELFAQMEAAPRRLLADGWRPRFLQT